MYVRRYRMGIFKRVLYILGAIVCIVMLVFLGMRGYSYFSEKRIQKINDSYVELTDAQLDQIDESFSTLKTLSNESKDLYVTQEDLTNDKSGFCKEEFLSALEVYDNTFINNSNIDSLRYFMSFCEFSVNHDEKDITIWSEKYNHLTTVEVNMRYPDFEKIIRYDLVKHLAKEGVKDVELSLDSDVVKDYFEACYDSNMLSFSAYVPLYITDDGEFKYFTDWLTSVPYIEQVLGYSPELVSLRSDDADYATTEGAIDLINSRDTDAIFTELIKHSNGEAKESLVKINDESQSVKEGLLNSVFSYGDIEYTCIKRDIVILDETVKTQGLLVAMPYYKLGAAGLITMTNVMHLENDESVGLVWSNLANALIVMYNLDRGV